MVNFIKQLWCNYWNTRKFYTKTEHSSNIFAKRDLIFYKYSINKLSYIIVLKNRELKVYCYVNYLIKNIYSLFFLLASDLYSKLNKLKLKVKY